MALPPEYNPLIKVIPSDPDRLPYLPVQVIYLIAQALPQPSQVFNLARVNKATWDYLQPALYECEVTYEARLVARFGEGLTKARSPPNVDDTGLTDEDDGDDSATENHEEGNCRRHCAHGLVTALCEVCGQRIAIENKRFESGFVDAFAWGRPKDFKRVLLQTYFKSPGMTALHWACHQGESALHVARKAIEAAKTHQPAYINGQGLRMRYSGRLNTILFGEIPPPLFTAVAFGNTKLCEKLIEAGCKINILQGKDFKVFEKFGSRGRLLQIHESCVRRPNSPLECQRGAGGCSLSDCQTAGHVVLAIKNIDTLGFLLDCGLDPQIGVEPLMHQATRTCNLAAIEILLDRFPDMISHRWDGLTCLHVLCKSYIGPSEGEAPSLEKLQSVAGYLVQRGADLEAQAGSESGRSPLQYAMKNSTFVNSSKRYAAEALIKLGAIWNQSLAPNGSADTILSHCVYQAALRGRRRRRRLPARSTPGPDSSPKDALAFARLVKAIIRSTEPGTLVPAAAQGSEPPMQAYLGAFKMLVVDRERVITQKLDTFALEAVGRLLLSTGISPDQGDIEKWTLVIAGNSKGQKVDKWAASHWRELVADLSSAAPATME